MNKNMFINLLITLSLRERDHKIETDMLNLAMARFVLRLHKLFFSHLLAFGYQTLFDLAW